MRWLRSWSSQRWFSIVAVGVSGVQRPGRRPAMTVLRMPWSCQLCRTSATFDLSGATVDADDVSVDRFCEVEATTHSVWFGYTPAYDSVLGAWRAGTPT